MAAFLQSDGESDPELPTLEKIMANSKKKTLASAENRTSWGTKQISHMGDPILDELVKCDKDIRAVSLMSAAIKEDPLNEQQYRKEKDTETPKYNTGGQNFPLFSSQGSNNREKYKATEVDEEGLLLSSARSKTQQQISTSKSNGITIDKSEVEYVVRDNLV